MRGLFARTVLTLAVAGVLASAGGCEGAAARKAAHLEKGEAYLAAENYDKALVEIKNALQIDAKDPEVLYELGTANEKSGRLRQALASYQAAVDVSPEHDNARARAGEARLYIMSGLSDRALELLKPALARHPDDPILLALRAVARRRQGDTAGAMADAGRAVKLGPDQEVPVAVLSGLYLSAGDRQRARTVIQDGVKKVPGSVDLRIVLARIYIEDGDKVDAEAVLLELVRMKPRDPAHRVRLGQFYARVGRPDEAEATWRKAIHEIPDDDGLKLSFVDFLAAQRGDTVAVRELLHMIAESNHDNELEFALANFYAGHGRPDDAEALLLKVIDRQGLDAAGFRARDQLANFYVQRNREAAALKLLDEVLAKSPRDSDALFLRGIISLARHNPRAAVADLRAVLRDQPKTPWVLRALARAHFANGEPDAAEETLRQAIEVAPTDLRAHLDLAQLLIRTGKMEQAVSMLTDVVDAHPDSSEALDLQYQASMASQDYITATGDANALLAMRPKQAMPYLYLGRVAQARGQTDKAIEWYGQAIEAQPDALDPLNEQIRLIYAANGAGAAMKRLDEFSNRHADNPLGPDAKGELLMRGGNVAAAREAFEAAIRRAPKWWISYRDLADAQLADGKSAAAIATLRNAANLVDDRPAIRLDLAQMLERTGDTDAAIGEYESLLRDDPQSDAAANDLAQLLATSKSDLASLDRARTLASRFAQSANPAFLDTYGWVLYKHGDVAASVPVLERVVASVSNDPIARYHLGMAESRLGAKSAARDNLALAVKSGRKFMGLDEAKLTLEKLDQPAAPPRS